MAARTFAVCVTYHTTNQATSSQLLFGHDAIMNTKFDADWKYIHHQKQQIVKENNHKENAKRIQQEYHHIGDQVLYRTDALDKFSTTDY